MKNGAGKSEFCPACSNAGNCLGAIATFQGGVSHLPRIVSERGGLGVIDREEQNRGTVWAVDEDGCTSATLYFGPKLPVRDKGPDLEHQREQQAMAVESVNETLLERVGKCTRGVVEGGTTGQVPHCRAFNGTVTQTLIDNQK